MTHDPCCERDISLCQGIDRRKQFICTGRGACVFTQENERQCEEIEEDCGRGGNEK